MLDIKFIRENLKIVKDNIEQRGMVFDEDYFLKVDKKRRDAIAETEELQKTRNTLSKDIGLLASKGAKIESKKEEADKVNKLLEDSSKKLSKIENEFKDYILTLPNLLDTDVPTGKDETKNVVLKEEKVTNKLDNAKNHLDLTIDLEMLDQDKASEISGSRFALLYSDIAKLHRSISNYMIDCHTKNAKYKEVNVPLMVNEKSLIGTGQLPKFREDLFEIKNKDNFFLIPTSEVPLTNIVSNKVVEKNNLPISYTCLSTCFRSEAGSYGKDTKGLIRQHQFDKVELVKITTEETSADALEEIVNDAENLLINLKLPYRKILLCSGDTGFSSSMTYDLEVWMPGQNNFLEISSCSNFKDFQSRRLNIKYKDGNSKTYAHTLNGSGLAVGRTLAAILENYQDKDGNIIVPDVIQPYMDKDIIKKEF
ncbi:MAG: serine--tRNA ligase [Pseudomonadota bacterium]|nr:serine--tRNA ligase [Pseudomonadota bacterium]